MEPPRPDLVVLSHLRWSWVWQRPQHLISRFATDHVTWFVEEPQPSTDVERPTMTWERCGEVWVGQLLVPSDARHLGFDSAEADVLRREVVRAAAGASPLVWIYTPLALQIAQELDPDRLIYDVMDDLASFKDASPQLRAAQREALRVADVVFTGGRSLHAGVTAARPEGTHCFPSGVETEHYRRDRASMFGGGTAARRRRSRPVAGYVGVIDERLDLELIDEMAADLDDWDIRIVGPVAKIDAGALPRRENITYPGPAAYAELPSVMAAFDVALMPFAMNEATRSISPTKTLEYLAADLPVVSTRVPDVVADYAHVVALRDDGRGFAGACRQILQQYDLAQHRRHCRPVLEQQHWDKIAGRMRALVLRTASDVEEISA